MEADGWWLYMLECRGGGIYVGIALDVDARFNKHKAGQGAVFTRLNRPERILCRVKIGMHGDARRIERAFKKLLPAEKRIWARTLGHKGGEALVGILPGYVNEGGHR